MNNPTPSRRTHRIHRVRLFLIGAILLLAGLAGSAFIYRTASDEPSGVLSYEIIDGTAYAVLASDSKQYRHDLERFGGKAAVFADEFNRWFSSLWHGKRLAGTVAVLSILIALAFFRAAYQTPINQPPEKRGGDERRGR